jgi:large subunit ribosomal protein L4
MASAKLFNLDGNEVGSVELNEGVFNCDVHPALIHEVAVAMQANKRQGNHETKTRTQVRGGGRKPYRQKGTGNARHGSTREPQMRGGGTVFGPHKRSYRTDTPASFKRKALCGVLTDRARNENLCVIETAEYAEPKTKPVVRLLAKLVPGGQRTLIVTADVNKNLLLSARNIPKVDVRTAADLNALDVLGAARVVLVQDAVAKLEERLS